MALRKNLTQTLAVSFMAVTLVLAVTLSYAPFASAGLIDKNIDGSFEATQIGQTILIPGEIKIGFDPLAGPNGTPYSGHIENGFVVTSISGTWQEAFNVGNPIPSIFHLTRNGPQAGVNIEKQDGNNFDLVSMQVGTGGSGNTGIDVSCIARNNNIVVGNHAFTFFGSFPTFTTFAFPATFSNIDSVDCTASNLGTTSVNFDYFHLRVNTPPVVTVALVPICDDDDDGLFRVQITVTDDNDPNPTVMAELNGIPVTNGQVVELEIDDETEVEVDDGTLEIEAPSFELRVTATDNLGLSLRATCGWMSNGYISEEKMNASFVMT